MTLKFDLPDARAIELAIPRFLQDEPIEEADLSALTAAFASASFSDIERSVMAARRVAALREESLGEALMEVARDRVAALAPKLRADIARQLVMSGRFSQRRAYDLTGVSRDTIRKSVRKDRPSKTNSAS
jgi:hypothetical protein